MSEKASLIVSVAGANAGRDRNKERMRTLTRPRLENESLDTRVIVPHAHQWSGACGIISLFVRTQKVKHKGKTNLETKVHVSRKYNTYCLYALAVQVLVLSNT